MTICFLIRIFSYMSNNRIVSVEQLAEVFKALSHPQRLRLLLRIVTCYDSKVYCNSSVAGIRQCIGDLGEGLGLAASTVSHHIKALRQAGLVKVERHGQKVECRIPEDKLQLLSTLLGSTGINSELHFTGGDRGTGEE